jgi:bifunctional N-acetylglucosamine-1-phosphate-uridyltransferase/glucosamine-1-phosphate-acetyltransferase GlmU-like protein
VLLAGNAVVVLYGDTPFIISPDTLDSMITARAKHDVVVLAAAANQIMAAFVDGDTLAAITEWLTQTATRAITPVQPGVICARCGHHRRGSATTTPREYYLTDIAALPAHVGSSGYGQIRDEPRRFQPTRAVFAAAV